MYTSKYTFKYIQMYTFKYCVLGVFILWLLLGKLCVLCNDIFMFLNADSVHAVKVSALIFFIKCCTDLP